MRKYYHRKGYQWKRVKRFPKRNNFQVIETVFLLSFSLIGISYMYNSVSVLGSIEDISTDCTDTYCDSANGTAIILHNNEMAENPSYKELIDFIQEDRTNWKDYVEGEYMCGDYAWEVHDNAEAAGIRAGFVYIKFAGDSVGHACNVFETTDSGTIFIDCTEADKIVQVSYAEEYKPGRISNSFVEYSSMGIVEDYDIYW